MYTEDRYGQAQQPAPRKNGMAKASFILGIVALMFCSFFYIALPCGAMAILCAVLSRTESRMAQRCRVAIVCGAIAMAMSAVFTGFAVHRVMNDPQMRAYLEYMLRTYTGDPDLQLDEFIDELLPFRNRTPDEPQEDSGERIRLQVGDTEAESEAVQAETEEAAGQDEAGKGQAEEQDGSKDDGSKDNTAGQNNDSKDDAGRDNAADGDNQADQGGDTNNSNSGQDENSDRNDHAEPDGDEPNLGIQKGEKLFL